MTFEGTRIVKYYAYDTNDLETPLDFSPCKNQTIKIISPPLNEINFESIKEFKKLIKIIKDNIELYNAFSPLYTDYCYPLSVLDKYDLILNDRREYIKEKEIPLCEKGCEYEGENLQKLQVICYCPIKVNMSEPYLLNYFQMKIKIIF